MREQVLLWLEQIESHEGVGVALLPTSNATAPFRLLVDRGKLCFGVELYEQPFLDMEFKREAPELFEELLDLFGQRQDELDGDPLLRCVVPRGAIELSEGDERAIAQQLLRIMFRSARMARGEYDRLQIEPFEGSIPRVVRFSPLELFIACRRDDLPDGTPARRGFEALREHASESWLFRRRERPHPFDSLVAHDLDVAAGLRRANAVCASFAPILEGVEQLSSEPARVMLAIEGGHFWSCVIDDALVSLQRHTSQQMGRVLTVIEALSGSKDT